MGYRSFHLSFASVGIVNIVDLVKTTYIIMLVLFSLQSARMTYKSAAIDRYVLGIRKET